MRKAVHSEDNIASGLRRSGSPMGGRCDTKLDSRTAIMVLRIRISWAPGRKLIHLRSARLRHSIRAQWGAILALATYSFGVQRVCRAKNVGSTDARIGRVQPARKRLCALDSHGGPESDRRSWRLLRRWPSDAEGGQEAPVGAGLALQSAQASATLRRPS